jgi:hypothetical protein
VGGDGALTRRKHRGQYALISGHGVGGVTHDAAANGKQHALRQQRPTLLARNP